MPEHVALDKRVCGSGVGRVVAQVSRLSLAAPKGDPDSDRREVTPSMMLVALRKLALVPRFTQEVRGGVRYILPPGIARIAHTDTVDQPGLLVNEFLCMSEWS